MKYVNPISADVLTALHAIQLHLAGVVSAETVTAILWGYASCDGEAYVSKKEALPIESIIVLLDEYGCDIDCEIQLADKEIEEYGPELGKLAEKEKQASERISNLLRGMKVKGALNEYATIALCLLTERRKIIKKHDAPLIASMMYRPITLHWESDTRLSAIIGQIEREYLSAFKTPGKIKWNDNVEDWEALKAQMLDYLSTNYENYIAFWIDQEDFVSYGYFDKLDETLLALESEKLLTIENMDVDSSQIRWKVRRNPKVMSNQGELPVYRGLVTGKKAIWRQADPTHEERFNESYAFHLWIYLLEHLNKPLPRSELEGYLIEVLPGKGPVDLNDIIEYLVQKLSKVSDTPRKKVGGWFHKDKQFIRLISGRN